MGCMDPVAENFAPAATVDGGGCTVEGCDGAPLRLAGRAERAALNFTGGDAPYNSDCAWVVVCTGPDEAALLRFTSFDTDSMLFTDLFCYLHGKCLKLGSLEPLSHDVSIDVIALKVLICVQCAPCSSDREI